MKHEYGLTTLHPWNKGMNNRASERALPDETVRNAVNVNFGAESRISCRPGMLKVLNAVNPQGGFSCPLGQYFVEDTVLKKFNTDNTATAVRSMIIGTEFTFEYANDVVYFSDGVACVKITATEVSNWGMAPPPAPLVSTAAGVYGAGIYLAAYCWVDAAGVESGCSTISSIVADDNSGFVFNDIPMAPSAQIVTLRIYLSTANGKVLYHVADTTAGSYTVAAGRYDGGNVCASLFIYPPPPGRLIRMYKGRAYAADSSGVVWYSEPFAPDRFRLGDSFLQFPKVVDIMQPVTGGIFFAYGKKTDFYAGTPEEGFTITEKFEYGGVYGTGRKILNTDNVCWQSQRGTVIGTPDGQCKNIQEENVAVDSAVSGSLLLKEEDGIRQIIASLKQPTTSTLAATSWIDAEIVRRGA